MGRFLVLFSLIFSFNAYSQPAFVPAVGLGGGVNTTGTTNVPTPVASQIGLANLTGTNRVFHVHAGSITAATAGHFAPFYKDFALWQVSGTLKATCFNIVAGNSVGQSQFQLVYDTSTFALDAASLTSGSYESGAAARYTRLLSASVLPVVVTFQNSIQFPTSAWPGIQEQAASAYSVDMDCIEQ